MDINATQSASSVLDQFQREPEVKNNELGKDEFLKLLVTQMENQNPLEPQDNGEFIAQLAQFSSLEGIDNLNASFSGFAASYQSNQALEASMLVGRQVLVPTERTELRSGEPVNGLLDLPQSSSDVRLSISDSNGMLVRQLALGSMPAGESEFNWDGLDNGGNVLPSGTYRIQAEALINGENEQVSTLLGANVNSVTLGDATTGMTLNLAGVGRMPLDQVRTIQ